MATKDPRVDTYIANAAAFAQPILLHLRGQVHAACPAVEETMKWSFPHFMYHGVLCSMAAFKQHCAFGFWRRALIVDTDDGGHQATTQAMGQFGRITALTDLPAEPVMAGYIRKAMALNESGVKSPMRSKAKPAPPALVPADFVAALKARPQALEVFENFSLSNQREYIEWITEAKREATRLQRLSTAIEWLAEGKPRNWKYMKG